MAQVNRRTVDLSAYPDLVVVYLGMRVNAFAGLKTLLGLGPQIEDSVKAKPDGLLLHEGILYSVFPLHTGMRHYWRDFETLERSIRAAPPVVEEFPASFGRHRFLARTLSGGIEAIYDDMPQPIGMMKFAPLVPAHRNIFSARQRLRREAQASTPGPVAESDLQRD